MVGMRNDVTKIKAINVDLVKSTLMRLGEATKARIAEETGISVVTCGKILNDLCRAGEVREMSKAQADYGRPAKSYSYNAAYSLVACIYVHTDGGKVLVSAVVSDLLGGIVSETIREIVRVNYDVIREQVARLRESHPDLSVLVVGVPAYVTDGRINLCNFKDLEGIPLGGRLAADFPSLKIVVENDANAAAYGYYKSNFEGRDTIVAFLFSPDRIVSGTGEFADNADSLPYLNDSLAPVFNLGAGFVVGGRILRGHTGFAGEVMSLPINQAEYNATRTVDSYITILASTIITIASVINPETIALSGGFLTSDILNEVRRRCTNNLPKHHMPVLTFRKDIHRDYIMGLLSIAREQLSYNMLLVYKD